MQLRCDRASQIYWLPELRERANSNGYILPDEESDSPIQREVMPVILVEFFRKF